MNNTKKLKNSRIFFRSLNSERKLKKFPEISSFSSLLFNLIQLKNLEVLDFLTSLGLSKSYSYQLLNGTKNPSRDTVIKICLGIGAKVEQANALLCLSGHHELYIKDKRDAIIYFSLTNQIALSDYNLIIEKENCLHLK